MHSKGLPLDMDMILLNRCTTGAVRAVYDRLEKRMGTELFLERFEFVLTD